MGPCWARQVAGQVKAAVVVRKLQDGPFAISAEELS